MLFKLNLFRLKFAPLIKVRVSGKHYRDRISAKNSTEALSEKALTFFKVCVDQVLALVSKIIAPFFQVNIHSFLTSNQCYQFL